MIESGTLDITNCPFEEKDPKKEGAIWLGRGHEFHHLYSYLPPPIA